MPVIRVLLVDDHQVIREGLKHILVPNDDIQVVGEAANGDEAMTKALQLHPDVVLMDIKMPGMDGITATRQLRERIPDICVVILTLYDGDCVTQAIEAGASGYILKEASREHLLQAIRDAHCGYAPLAPPLTRGIITKLADLSRASRDAILTERQREILKLIAAGLARKEVAIKLYISEATVKKELTVIFEKLSVGDQTQAVVEAMRQRLI